MTNGPRITIPGTRMMSMVTVKVLPPLERTVKARAGVSKELPMMVLLLLTVRLMTKSTPPTGMPGAETRTTFTP